MPVWVGDDDRKRQQVVGLWVGDDTTTARRVEKAWVGDSKGFPQLVYERITQNTLTATPVAWNRIDLSWTTAAPNATYTLKAGNTTIYTGKGTTYSHTGLSGGKQYTYTLISSVEGNTVTATASATTPVRPTTTTTVTLTAIAAGSYREQNLALRTTGTCFYGRWDGTWGYQRSLVVFNIPANVRNCISVNKVEFAWYNNHHNYVSGGRVSMVVHHRYFTSAPAVFPGSTGALLSGGQQVRYLADRNSWIGGVAGNYVDITNLNASGRAPVREEFRTGGAVGLGLIWAYTGQAGYGYAENTPQLRLTYTHY